MMTKSSRLSQVLRINLSLKYLVWFRTAILQSFSHHRAVILLVSVIKQRWKLLNQCSPWCMVINFGLLVLLWSAYLKSGGRDAILVAEFQAFVMLCSNCCSIYKPRVRCSGVIFVPNPWFGVVVAADGWETWDVQAKKINFIRSLLSCLS